MISSLRARVRALAAARGFDVVREQPDLRAQAVAAAASAAACETHIAPRCDAYADRAPVTGTVR